LVGGTAWLGIAWWMNCLNNLANSMKVIGVIEGVVLMCYFSSEVTMGLASQFFFLG